jgi:membrane-bound lytic murein transglycosylase MltF
VTVTIGGGLDVCETEHRNERDADMICAADLAESRSRTTEQAPRKYKGLMTFAAYNAGPGRLKQLRSETAKRGLDPNIWFGNVERVASERIGRETVTYVSNIYKYYVTYKLISDQRERREAAKAQVTKDH